MNSAINDIKNTLERINSRITEVKNKMAEINETERKKKKKYKEMRIISETSGTMLNTPTLE